VGAAFADLLSPDRAWTAFSVLLPIAAGLASVLLGRRADRLIWAVAPLLLGVAVLVAGQVALQGETIRQPAGGWQAPLGIELRADGLSAAFLITTAIVAGAVGLFARVTFSQSLEETRAGFAFWPLFYGLWAALNAVFVSADLFNLYVALELLTLTAVALVAIQGKPETLAAAARYMRFALFGSVAYLLGVILLYGAYATLDIRLLRWSAEPTATVLIAGGLMTVGLLVKTALFPFHAWLPPAHAGAPAPVSALLSGLVPKASFFILVRVWFDALPHASSPALAQLLGGLGAAAVLFGSLMALRQQRLKLVIAYSTVAQIGYLFFIFPLAGAGTEAQPWIAGAWNGAIFHGLSHAFAKAAMFLAAGTIVWAVGSDRMEDMCGLARALPASVFAFGLASLSLMGLPPSGGFLAKYLMLTSALAAGAWIWGVLLVAGGLMSAAYLFRPLNRMLAERDEDAPELPRPPLVFQVAPLVLALCSIALGLASLGPFTLLQIGRPVEAATGLLP